MPSPHLSLGGLLLRKQNAGVGTLSSMAQNANLGAVPNIPDIAQIAQAQRMKNNPIAVPLASAPGDESEQIKNGVARRARKNKKSLFQSNELLNNSNLGDNYNGDY